MARQHRSHWDKVWKNKDGKVVIWQNPNLPLWVWIASTILSKVMPYGQLNFAAALVSFGSLFMWAWLEISEGANYFRRVLGATVLIYSIASRL